MRKVLIVEDDKAILNTIGTIFTNISEQPYEVLLFSGGDEAIDFMKATPDVDIGLVLCDVRMQKGDGIAFIKKFKRFRPKTPFYFMTGYTDISHHDVREWGASGVIVKPFKVTDILDALFESEKVA